VIPDIRAVDGNNARASPSHQRVLPPATTLKDIEVNTPLLSFSSTGLHGVPCGLVYPHSTMLQLNCRFIEGDAIGVRQLPNSKYSTYLVKMLAYQVPQKRPQQ